jgi:hypothetical protein
MKRNTYDRVWGSKHPVTLGTHGHTKQHGGFAEQRQRGKGSWVVGVVDVRRNEITDTVQIDDCGVGSGTNRSSRNKKQQETARIFPKRRTVRKPKTEKKNRQNFNTWAGVLGGSPPMNGDNVPFGQMFVLDQCIDQGSQHGGHGVHRGIGRDFMGGIVVKAAVLQHQPTFAFDVVDTVGEGGLPGKREERKGGREGGREEEERKERKGREKESEREKQQKSITNDTTQPPHNHHTNHHTTTTQPPHNHHTTTTQPPHNHHTNTTQPPHNHHTNTTQTQTPHKHHTTQPPTTNHQPPTTPPPHHHHTTTTYINVSPTSLPAWPRAICCSNHSTNSASYSGVITPLCNTNPSTTVLEHRNISMSLYIGTLSGTTTV